MSSKEVSNFTWKRGRSPAKMINFAGLEKIKMSLVAAGIQILLYTPLGGVDYQ